MKIVQSDQMLVVKDSSLWISLLCAAGALGLIWDGWAAGKAGTLLVALLFLAFAVAWLRSSTWEFDAARRVARWHRFRYLKSSSGEIPFSEIFEVTLESTASDRSQVITYRLALVTPQSAVPLSDAFGGGQDKYAAMRDEIVRFLRPKLAEGVATKRLMS